jgi:hypothetical protein
MMIEDDDNHNNKSIKTRRSIKNLTLGNDNHYRGNGISSNLEEIVCKYFQLIKRGNISRLLNLFAHNAVVYEPFSKLGMLSGKSAIEPFLSVAIMSNSGLSQKIEFQKSYKTSDYGDHSLGDKQDNNNGNKNNNAVTALVTFQRGESIRGTFTFEFGKYDNDNNNSDHQTENKIISLHIQFIK